MKISNNLIFVLTAKNDILEYEIIRNFNGAVVALKIKELFKFQ